MANKVEIIVVARDDTGPVFDKIERKAKEAGTRAGDAAGEGIRDGINNAVGDASVGDLSDSFESAGTDAGEAFNRGIESSLSADEARLAALRELDESGFEAAGEDAGRGFSDGFDTELDAGVRESGGRATATARTIGSDIGESINSGIDDALSRDNDGGKSLITRLKSMTSEVVGIGKGIGTTIATEIGEAFEGGGTFEAMKTGLITALVAAAVVTAPLVVSALAGLIGATTVLGTAVAGAILAFENDPRLQDAGKALGEKLFGELKNDSNVFAEPILNSIQIIADAFEKLRPNIQNIFGNSAGLIEPFVAGITNGIEEITQGIDNLVEKAGPELLAGLSAGFETVAGSLAKFFTVLGDNGPEIADAMQVAFIALGGAIDALSVIVDVAATAFGAFEDRLRAVHKLLGEDPGIEGVWREGINSGRDALDAMAGAADRAVQSNQNLADQLLAASDPMFAVIDAQKKLVDAGDKYDAAVKKWGPDSQQAADALVNVEKAAVQATKAGLDLGDAAETGWTPQLQAAAEAAGLDADTINTLRDYFNQARDAGEKMAKTYAVKVQTTGIAGAISGLAGVKAAVDAIPSSKTITINTISAGGLAGKATGGNIGAAATGGIRGNMVLVGEGGPEIVKLPVGSTVFPNGQSRRMLGDQQYQEDQTWQKQQGGSMDSDAIVSELREMRKAFMSLKLYVNERVIGGLQGYEADILGRAG